MIIIIIIISFVPVKVLFLFLNRALKIKVYMEFGQSLQFFPRL